MCVSLFFSFFLFLKPHLFRFSLFSFILFSFFVLFLLFLSLCFLFFWNGKGKKKRITKLLRILDPIRVSLFYLFIYLNSLNVVFSFSPLPLSFFFFSLISISFEYSKRPLFPVSVSFFSLPVAY
jgi:hypothetical protein